MSDNEREFSGSEIAFIVLSAVAGVVAGVLVFLAIYFLIKLLIKLYRKHREKALPAQFQRSKIPEEKVEMENV